MVIIVMVASLLYTPFFRTIRTSNALQTLIFDGIGIVVPTQIEKYARWIS